jgi:putative GTP pyrophosphokinase
LIIRFRRFEVEQVDDAAISTAVDDYQKLLPTLEAFRIQLEGLLRSLLDREERPYHQIESRCKSVDSFREKVARKRYVDPAREMTDVVGLRVITFYDSDVDLVARIIQREFVLDDANTEDKRAPTAEDRFGYRSFHLVCSLNPDRAQLPEWERFAGTAVEIQIRTVLAHAWAAVDHQLGYKSDPGLSNAGKRLMARISAMLETADELFDRLRYAEDEYRAGVEAEETPSER